MPFPARLLALAVSACAAVSLAIADWKIGSLLLRTNGVILFPDMSGQGSTGNVIAAICSFFIPGLGQLVQGRPVMALIQFCLAGLLWFFLLGWIIHLWSILDAAMFKP